MRREREAPVAKRYVSRSARDDQGAVLKGGPRRPGAALPQMYEQQGTLAAERGGEGAPGVGFPSEVSGSPLNRLFTI